MTSLIEQLEYAAAASGGERPEETVAWAARNEITRLRAALRDARAYITSRITYSEVGHEGDEKPVIAKINVALEQE